MHKKKAGGSQAAAAPAAAAICMDFISASGCISNEQRGYCVDKLPKLPSSAAKATIELSQLIQIQFQP